MTRPMRQLAKKKTIEIPQNMNEIAALLKDPKHFSAAANTRETRLAIEVKLTEWAALDTKDVAGVEDFAAFCYHFLALPIEVQQQFTVAMAMDSGFPIPSYEKVGAGAAGTGRKQLAAVIYGAHPEMLAVAEGQKDSLAGKRISWALLQYKRKHGLTTPKKVTEKLPKRALHIAFDVLFDACESEDEQEVLEQLMERVGISSKALEAWIDEIAADGARELATVPASPAA